MLQLSSVLLLLLVLFLFPLSHHCRHIIAILHCLLVLLYLCFLRSLSWRRLGSPPRDGTPRLLIRPSPQPPLSWSRPPLCPLIRRPLLSVIECSSSPSCPPSPRSRPAYHCLASPAQHTATLPFDDASVPRGPSRYYPHHDEAS